MGPAYWRRLWSAETPFQRLISGCNLLCGCLALGVAGYAVFVNLKYGPLLTVGLGLQYLAGAAWYFDPSSRSNFSGREALWEVAAALGAFVAAAGFLIGWLPAIVTGLGLILVQNVLRVRYAQRRIAQQPGA